MISPDHIDAFSRLINSRGFAIAACLFILAGVLYYIVNPIPGKLDAILSAVKSGCGRSVAQTQIRATE